MTKMEKNSNAQSDGKILTNGEEIKRKCWQEEEEKKSK